MPGKRTVGISTDIVLEIDLPDEVQTRSQLSEYIQARRDAIFANQGKLPSDIRVYDWENNLYIEVQGADGKEEVLPD